MSLRLILTRHAKSSWDDPMLDDHDRPLNKRGRVAAKAVGRWLAGNGFEPQQALVSSARRTRETWERIARAFAAPPAPAVLDQLYAAEPDAMLTILRTATAPVVMMVGHNPGIAFFAQGLVHSLPGDVRFESYPTAATAVIDFDAEAWDQLQWRTGHVTAFAAARDLVAAEAAAEAPSEDLAQE